MSDAPAPNLAPVLPLVAGALGARPTLDHPSIDEWELAWRRDSRPRVQAWLDGTAAVTPAEVVALLGLFQSEARDLQVCFEHGKNADELERLRITLRDGRQGRAREQVFSDVQVFLDRMETMVRNRPEEDRRVVNGVARKWTVITALLSAADARFPYLRPTSTDPDEGPVPAAVFGGLSWRAAPSSTRYAAYCARIDGLCVALVAHGLASEGITPLDASAWLVAAHAMASEPAALEALARLVQRRPVILQGPPGTGKTRRADGLAGLLAGDDGRRVLPLDLFTGQADVGVVTAFVQFHAGYGYDDFVRGLRRAVVGDGLAFTLRDGPFARMASLALRHPDVDFLLVIDEIDRADLARVLGECIYLLDRRVPHAAEAGPTVASVLAGRDAGAVALRDAPEHAAASPAEDGLLARLCAPTNLLLVGTMRAADPGRSGVDPVLRRRFAFVDVRPDIDVVRTRQPRPRRERLAGWMRQLNGEEGDPGLIRDPRFHVGHAWFLGDEETVRASLRHQLLPLLDEYRRAGRLTGDDAALDALFDAMRRFPDA